MADGRTHVNATICAVEDFPDAAGPSGFLAAARRDELEELLVEGGVDARLAHPLDLQRDQGAEELLRLLHVGGDVVVDEEDQRPLSWSFWY